MKLSKHILLLVIFIPLFLYFVVFDAIAQVNGILPKSYQAAKTRFPILIDGKGDDKAWQQASWTDDFVDIEGAKVLRPGLKTRCKMLWDKQNLYIYAEMEEPHVWAMLKQRDTVVFHDNDFEVFIDPDGDSYNYYELEVNALGTVWDLKLNKPYRKGGRPNSAWNIKSLQLGIHVDGSLNRPADKDNGWSVEILIPWNAFDEFQSDKKHPGLGEEKFRINFSRVQWQTKIQDGRYVKKINPKTGRPFAENNWVWSPQGAVNMHIPSNWGYLMLHD